MSTRLTQLGQARPSTTNATVLYQHDGLTTRTQLKTLLVANTTGGAVTFRIFHPPDTTATYDQSTALFYDIDIDANSTTVIELCIYLDNVKPYLAVRSSVANALTFTVYGDEF
jgi:hypothetical protein